MVTLPASTSLVYTPSSLLTYGLQFYSQPVSESQSATISSPFLCFPSTATVQRIVFFQKQFTLVRCSLYSLNTSGCIDLLLVDSSHKVQGKVEMKHHLAVSLTGLELHQIFLYVVVVL